MAVPDISTAARAPWREELRATLALAWPLVLANLAQIGLTTTDVVVLGRLGAAELAAGTLGANLYQGPLLFATGLVTATAPLMAAAMGARRHSLREVRRTFRQGLWSAALVSLPCWLLFWNSEAVLLWLGQAPELAAGAQTFLRALQWGVPAALAIVAMRSFVSALERPLVALAIGLATVAINVAASVTLVFGHFGLPALGLAGCGFATSLANWCGAIAFALVLARSRRFRRHHLFGRWWRPDGARLAALWRLGLPIGLTIAFEITVFNASAFLMGRFGATAIAAHAIALQIAATTFMVPLGIGQAATVRVGLARGARDVDAIARAGSTAFALAGGFMTASALLILAIPGTLIGLFMDPAAPGAAAVQATAAGFLVCAAVFQIVDGLQVAAAGMLRGLQDTRQPMLYAALGYWGIGFTLGWALAFATPLGGLGIWIGLATGLGVVALALTLRWVRRAQLGLLPAG
jgi:MATE family multidrug resistance protein